MTSKHIDLNIKQPKAGIFFAPFATSSLPPSRKSASARHAARTARAQVLVLATGFVRALPLALPPSQLRGRRETGCPAAPAAPNAVRRPGPNALASVQGPGTFSVHEPNSPQVQSVQPASLRNGCGGLLRALPGDKAPCHRRLHRRLPACASSTPHYRRQDHTTSPSAAAPVVRASLASPG